MDTPQSPINPKAFEEERAKVIERLETYNIPIPPLEEITPATLNTLYNLLETIREVENESAQYRKVADETERKLTTALSSVRELTAAENFEAHTTGTTRQVDALKERILVLEEERAKESRTGLYNRDPFRSAVENFIKRKNDFPEEVASVIYFDLNYLKFVNDHVSHAAGDAVIAHVADILKTRTEPHGNIAARLAKEVARMEKGVDEILKHPSSLRSIDLLEQKSLRSIDLLAEKENALARMNQDKKGMAASIGGDEFAVLIYHHNQEQAEAFAKKIANEISAKPVKYADPIGKRYAFRMTAAYGVREVHANDKLASILGDADHRMFDNKEDTRQASQKLFSESLPPALKREFRKIYHDTDKREAADRPSAGRHAGTNAPSAYGHIEPKNLGGHRKIQPDSNRPRPPKHR